MSVGTQSWVNDSRGVGMTDVRWRRVQDGSDSRAIIAVDFGPGRREAGFADLAGGLGAEFTILEPIVDSADGDLLSRTAAEHIAQWTSDLREQKLQVAGVLGYCAGASLACALAADLAEQDEQAPPIVLLDPRAIDPPALYANFESAVESFADVTEPDEMASVRAAVREATEADPTLKDPKAMVTTIAAAYERVVNGAGELLGMDEELTGQFTEHFRSYLSYLALAAQTGIARSVPENAVVLISAGFTPPAGWDAQQVFPVSREDLLSDPAVAAAVARILGGRS